ncbi:hypothetical protein [Frankia sp. QA3]|uniref:hypothetical protein n=1 Tax=Frankia sp. QA3 TaxID=710111 RepID=UPI003510B81C
MHERVTDAASLMVGPDAERPEREHRGVAHRGAGAQDMVDDLVRVHGRDERERGYPRRTGTKVVHEGDLDRELTRFDLSGEGRPYRTADRCRLPRKRVGPVGQ